MVGNKYSVGIPKSEKWYKIMRECVPWNKGTKGIMKAWNKKYPDFWTCQMCKKKFPNKYGTKNKYCSKECVIEAQKRKIINGGQFKNKELHPAWKGGIASGIYPLGWTNTFREQIRQRDGYKCQICGIPEIECNTKLIVHHIDYNKYNINKDNLITLCRKCHTKTNYNREYWVSYFNNHTSTMSFR